jgi:hypothetical protein
MALAETITATGAGKLAWRLHDNGNGYHVSVDDYRLDCVDGTYTLRKAGIVLETAEDTDNLLETAIESYIDSTTSSAISDFIGKLA